MNVSEESIEVDEIVGPKTTQKNGFLVTDALVSKTVSAIKELPRGYIEVSVNGALSGVYYLVPYNGRIRNYTTKKTAAMFISQLKAGKEVMIPVSVVEEDRIIFIA